jgi:MFS family permease
LFKKRFFEFLFSNFIGTGMGMCYFTPIAIAMRLFPKKKGLLVGFIMIGFSLGEFFFPLLQTLYINPDNASPDEPYSDEFPKEKY